MHDKPYAPSCDQNRDAILAVIRPRLRAARRLLEIGSGTGQHAAYFAPALSHLTWQTSDVAENLPGIRAWLAEAAAPNTPEPAALDVLGEDWPEPGFDAAFSANTAHIMSEPAVAAMFGGLGRTLSHGALFLLYGPFNRDGRYTAESNREFDAWLRARDGGMGVRDMGWLDELAGAAGFERREVVAMPSDNFILVWERREDME
jgi:cyclopropane fatty-acyl-phospholipid synthase-like methyltransferase